MRTIRGLVAGIVVTVLGFGSESAWAGDALVTLDSTDGSSAFIVRDAESNELARVQSDGKIGIGTTNPTYELEVNGEIESSHFGLDSVAYFQTQIID